MSSTRKIISKTSDKTTIKKKNEEKPKFDFLNSKPCNESEIVSLEEQKKLQREAFAKRGNDVMRHLHNNPVERIELPSANVEAQPSEQKKARRNK